MVLSDQKHGENYYANNNMYTYFKKHEITKLKKQLVRALDKARGYAQIPFIITSGYRTKEENTRVGGAVNSAHLRGWAVDIKATSNENKDRILIALSRVGFKRIGIYRAHIHADRDRTKSPAIWFNN